MPSIFTRRENWLESAAGARARRAQRRRVEVVAGASIEPRSKHAIRATEKEAFQSALTQALAGRRGFRSPIALELDLFVAASNPPEIHTIAKNYIDLTYAAPAGRGRLMKDDRQVRYLAVQYIRGLDEPSIFLRATRISCLREDARLLHGLLDRSDEFEDASGHAFDALRELERNKERLRSAHGGAYDMHRRFYLADIQRSWLARTESLLHRVLLNLVSGVFAGNVSELHFGNTRLPAIDLEGIERRFLFSPSISRELGPLPRKEGDGAIFRDDVRAALQELRSSNPLMFPLLTELGVAILLVPPVNGGIDLDNLARKVIPLVHSVLEPPGRRPMVDPSTVKDLRLRAFFEEEARRARRLPKHHVTRYEVIELLRRSDDPASGYVRLALCDGARGRTFAEFVRASIEKGEDP